MQTPDIPPEQLAFMYSLLQELVPKIRDPVTVIINYSDMSRQDIERLKQLIQENSRKFESKTVEDIDNILTQLLEISDLTNKQTEKILKIVEAIMYQVFFFKAMSEYKEMLEIDNRQADGEQE